MLLNIHIAETKCTLSLDSSGESLHRRGYRQEAVEAPLNEVLAAGMILMTGWRGECDLIDPMCGSGTIPIEAALIARNIAPGVFRKEFAFEKWIDFDQELFDTIYNDDSQEREFTHKIYGYDNNPKANEIATHNIKAAGVSKDMVLKMQPFQQFEQPTEKHHHHQPSLWRAYLYQRPAGRLSHDWRTSETPPRYLYSLVRNGMQSSWKVQGISCRRRGVEQGPQNFVRLERLLEKSPCSVERDVNWVAKDASSTANADQENSRTAKSAFPRQERSQSRGRGSGQPPRERREFGGERRTRSGESSPESKREAGKKEEE